MTIDLITLILIKLKVLDYSPKRSIETVEDLCNAFEKFIIKFIY